MTLPESLARITDLPATEQRCPISEAILDEACTPQVLSTFLREARPGLSRESAMSLLLYILEESKDLSNFVELLLNAGVQKLLGVSGFTLIYSEYPLFFQMFDELDRYDKVLVLGRIAGIAHRRGNENEQVALMTMALRLQERMPEK